MIQAFYAAVFAIVFFSILSLVHDPETAQIATGQSTQGRSYAY